MRVAATETDFESTVRGPVGRSMIDAASIPPVTRREAYALARKEYEMLLAVVESLREDDWQRPTACTLWDVRSMVSHISGALAGYASWHEFARQYSPWSHRPYRGRFGEMVDKINAVQVDDRAARSPEQLISELRAVGPKALRVRYKVPKVLRLVPMPAGAFGFISTDYLLDVIYSRDMWMHRLDLCRATGRETTLTLEHDGRMVALVLRDLARSLTGKLEQASVTYVLDGAIGDTYRIGLHRSPSASIKMDVLDFNLLASGRISSESALALGLVEFDGDTRLANLALQNTSVLY